MFYTVYAKDGGLPPNYAKATVRIRVLDENDNTPNFGRFYYSIEVPENLEAMPLFTLRANDQDSGESGIINYKITSEFFFTINFIAYFIPEDEFDSQHINDMKNLTLLFFSLQLEIYLEISTWTNCQVCCPLQDL